MNHHAEKIGKVSELWRYPVKSMLGERCESFVMDERGVAGDRLYAVRTEDDRLGSGKDSDRFCAIEGLFRFSSLYDGEVPVLTFPDGVVMRGDDPDVHSALTRTLGQTVRLAREDDITHLDAGPVHVFSTGALRWLGAALGENVDARRFRPNLLLDVEGDSAVENGWTDAMLTIGDTVQLLVGPRTTRCCMTGFAQSKLPADPRILKRLGELTDARFGIYACVVTPGTIRRGDVVTLSE